VEVTASAEDHQPTTAVSGPTAVVPKAASLVKVTRWASKQVYGAKQPVVVAARVQAAGGAPSGKVVFRDGTKKLATITVRGGTVSLALPRTLKVGTHKITAQFVPSDPLVAGSTSSSVKVKVTKAKPKVTAKLMKKTVTKKTRPKVKVKVSATGVAKPTGKIAVYVGKKKLRTVRLKAKHKGSITITL